MRKAKMNQLLNPQQKKQTRDSRQLPLSQKQIGESLQRIALIAAGHPILGMIDKKTRPVIAGIQKG